MDEKVLRRTTGDEHPATLTAMQNLAADYSGQGKEKEATDLYEKVLKARKLISL